MSHTTSETRFAILLFTDIVGSTDLKARHGVPAYSAALRIHNNNFERAAGECRGIRILQNMGDGYFAEAGSVAEALRFALLFQDAMRLGPWGEIRLTTRVGIHAGEVTALVTEGGCGIVAPAADLAARVMSLAIGGQILLTRFPFDEARHFLREHPALAGGAAPPLRWLAHGPYLFKGRDEPLEIFEVGAEGLAPLTPPPGGEKAKRAIRPGEEETLGWRPAMGLEIPGRPGWQLTGKLGAGGFGEVWTGEHAKLRQRRAFKFCFDNERLRALKREVTLVRLLRTALGNRDDIVRLHELKLDEPPFYLESDLAPHGNLLQWAEKQGGLAALPLAQRIALVAHTATALAAAHSIGVLHKDIKPTNILIFDAPEGSVRPRLVDFGIGTLADPTVLGQHGITAAGFTRATIQHSTGTPTYSPPEYLAGKPYTVQGDVYGLGVLLYQLVTAKPLDPLAIGWERDIPDLLLREDIAACVDGDPARRLPSAADLADRLFHLDQRRAEIAEQERLIREAAARAKSEAAAVVARIRATRLSKLAAGFAVLALLALSGGVFAWVNQHKADAARKDEVRARQGAQAAEKIAQAEARRADNAAVEAKRTLATSDFLQADRLVEEGDLRKAIAYLARALRNDPQNSSAQIRLLSLLNQHNWPIQIRPPIEMNPIKKISLSADGKLLLIVSYADEITIWNIEQWAAVHESLEHPDVIEAAFSADQEKLYSISPGELRTWEVRSGKLLKQQALSDVELGRVAGDLFTGNMFGGNSGRFLTISKGTQVRFGDAENGVLGKPLSVEGKIAFACLNPKGTRAALVVSEGGRGRLKLMSTDNPNSQVTVPSELLVTNSLGGNVQHVATNEINFSEAQFSADGTRLLTTVDGMALIWDVATGKKLVQLNSSNDPTRFNAFNIHSASFSLDASRLATWGIREVQIWNSSTGSEITKPLKTKQPIESVFFSRDARFVAAICDNTVWLWDASSGAELTEPINCAGRIFVACFNDDGTQLITQSGRRLDLWDLKPTKPFYEPWAVSTNIITAASFSKDEKLMVLVVGHSRYLVQVWDLEKRSLRAELHSPKEPFTSTVFNSDATKLITVTESQVNCWDTAGGKLLQTFDTQKEKSPLNQNSTGTGLSTILTAAYSTDEQKVLIITRSDWFSMDCRSGRIVNERHFPSPIWSATFSLDRRMLALGSANKVQVLDLASGGKPQFTADLRALSAKFVFSPNNRWLFKYQERTSKGDQTFDLKEGKTSAEPLAFDSSIDGAAFSMDSTRLMTVSGAEIRLWDIEKRNITMFWQADADRALRVFDAVFSQNGRQLLAVTPIRFGSEVRVLDSTLGKEISSPLELDDDSVSASSSAVSSPVFLSSDAQHVLRARYNGSQLWRLNCLIPSAPVADITLKIAEAIGGYKIDAEPLPIPADEPMESLDLIRNTLAGATTTNQEFTWARWFLADRTARTLSPESSITTSEYIEKLLAAAATNQYMAADKIINQVMEIDRNQPQAILLLARRKALLDLFLNIPSDQSSSNVYGVVEGADIWTQLAVRLNPSNAPAFLCRAVVLAQSQRYDEAIGAVDRALQLNPRSADIWNAKGKICLARKESETALFAYSEAIKLSESEPKQPAQKRAALHSRRAELLTQLGKQGEAAADAAVASELELSLKTESERERQKQLPFYEQVNCINNLRSIDLAKEEWAVENEKPAGSPVTEDDLKDILLAPFRKCPSGGVYKLNVVGATPTCSIPGHVVLKSE